MPVYMYTHMCVYIHIYALVILWRRFLPLAPPLPQEEEEDEEEEEAVAAVAEVEEEEKETSPASAALVPNKNVKRVRGTDPLRSKRDRMSDTRIPDAKMSVP